MPCPPPRIVPTRDITNPAIRGHLSSTTGPDHQSVLTEAVLQAATLRLMSVPLDRGTQVMGGHRSKALKCRGTQVMGGHRSKALKCRGTQVMGGHRSKALKCRGTQVMGGHRSKALKCRGTQVMGGHRSKALKCRGTTEVQDPSICRQTSDGRLEYQQGRTNPRLRVWSTHAHGRGCDV
jgi:hypothetical protein